MFPSNKILCIAACFMLALTSWLYAEDDSSVRQRLDEVLGALPSLLSKDATGAVAQAHLRDNELTNRLILPYFYAADSPLAEPSPERLRRVRQVEDILHAHEPSLLAVLSASSKQNSVPDQLHRLLAFTRPTPQVKAALLSVAANEVPIGSSREDALNTLFMLGLDDDTVRKSVIESIGHRDELHSRAAFAKEIMGDAALRWGLPDMLPLYQAFLSVPYKIENYPARGGRAKLQSHYLLALRGLATFGPQASGLAELIKGRMAEMNEIEDADLISAANETLFILEGKVRPKLTINLKGELLGISKLTFQASKTAAASSSPTTAVIVKATQQSVMPKDATAKPTTSKPSEAPASTSMWGVIVGLIVTTMGLLWLWLKRR